MQLTNDLLRIISVVIFTLLFLSIFVLSTEVVIGLAHFYMGIV